MIHAFPVSFRVLYGYLQRAHVVIAVWMNSSWAADAGDGRVSYVDLSICNQFMHSAK